MKYIALLRGINVGGNSMIKMADLKTAIEDCGFENVLTYINSGNVIFESDKTDVEKIIIELEKKLFETFNFTIAVVIISADELKSVVKNIPTEWKTSKDLRCYIAFVKLPTAPQAVVAEIKLNAEVDSAKTFEQVVYMTTKLEGLTKSGFAKLAGKKIYKEITIRNFNTVKKLLELLEK